jgi:hypothetical protein
MIAAFQMCQFMGTDSPALRTVGSGGQSSRKDEGRGSQAHKEGLRPTTTDPNYRHGQVHSPCSFVREPAQCDVCRGRHRQQAPEPQETVEKHDPAKPEEHGSDHDYKRRPMDLKSRKETVVPT